MLILIWAEDNNGIIGNNNNLPWSIPSDMQFFKNTTINNVVVMGRKTFDSLGKKPLPKRQNIVLTSDLELIENQPYDNVEFTSRLKPIIELSKSKDVYIIGGLSIYNQFMPYADMILRTKIQKSYKGNTRMNDVTRDFLKTKTIKVKNKKEPELWFETYVRLDK